METCIQISIAGIMLQPMPCHCYQAAAVQGFVEESIHVVT